MKKISFLSEMKKQSFLAITGVILASCLVLIGCSGMMSEPVKEIPSDLRNTAWTRQISGSETVRINFGRNTMAMSSNIDSSQYNQEWDYRGANCCGNGYCGFYNGQDSLDFRYTCRDNRLNINRCNVQSLNGSWTRE